MGVPVPVAVMLALGKAVRLALLVARLREGLELAVLLLLGRFDELELADGALLLVADAVLVVVGVAEMLHLRQLPLGGLVVAQPQLTQQSAESSHGPPSKLFGVQTPKMQLLSGMHWLLAVQACAVT